MNHLNYEIWTLQDILNVPADRRGDCLRDIEYTLTCLDLLAGDVASPIRWTDDDSRNVTFGITNDGVNVVDTMTLEVTERSD